MKKAILGLSLLAALPLSAHAAQSIGAFFGSPMSGVQYKHHDLRFSLGVDDFGVAVDKTFNLGSLANDPSMNNFYTFVGGQYVDDKHNKLGVRAGVGFEVPVERFEIYGELGPTLYMVEDFDADLEGALGIRYRF
ncbi:MULTISPECIES: hypothetical protein [Photobacterium]|uniref:Outer membrane protein beta-barrel domain-containing protein n=1 Tax=Photobacterium ganghwense TaxID=320778 RepID=A0A0J1JX24_9GAMM|nr:MULTISPECIES: hypothetical protein [Photobacterium]KLV06842.1 hypothetical protein ABT57_18085 [Photobacterium ganghwense]MBV1842237.1 hypothetical protein [Photobacterium ganghwense]PSU10625.1 hypothetical protein C9I92_00335 [Photobacterium ganghwense]QSV12769.1 hypothetical protein FH974_08175 [Photobacterium ganghwense]